MDSGEGGVGADEEVVLRGFRNALYRALGGWTDALFELSDALLEAGTPVGSIPALSLEPVFRRGHGSLYKALARGRVDGERLRAALAAHRPADWPAVFAVDASTWPRCDAETSPGRGFYYHPSRHSAGQPIVAGWSYQWIAGLSWAPDSWTAPLDVARLSPADNPTDATLVQVRSLVERLGPDGPLPLFVFDAGYDPIALGAGLADARAAICVRTGATGSSMPTRCCPHRARSAGRAGTGRSSHARTRRAGRPLTRRSPATTPATAGWRSRPGPACIRSSRTGAAGSAPMPRSCAGR
jgi:hypothetical protein